MFLDGAERHKTRVAPGWTIFLFTIYNPYLLEKQ